ncbi:N-acetylated-alpha-linked acidic dipeptidase 2 [Aphelenchoides avenae]|nr:N-acetylated-alpha-linked acidic dipeptidase 2 [Aphelenchus avenae]
MEEPHPAGTPANARVAEKKLNSGAGTACTVSSVHFVKYDVLLDYPDYEKRNHVSILDDQNRTIYQSDGVSPVIIPEEQRAKGAGVQWVACGKSGIVEGDVVYCHYGSSEDFKRLDSLGVSVRGKRALLRYGFGFRGNKVKAAEERGAIGAILYSDPGEVAKGGTDPAHMYPSTEWMPPKATQRGSIQNVDGDALTPLYPSKPDIYRSLTIEEARKERMIAGIPVLPLSYTDAYEILVRLRGRPAPRDWSGGLNITYHVGPGFDNRAERLRVEVNGGLETREIQNVVGYIKGAYEPDKYVILGNHFDAWVYGSIDPNSATAILAEVARAMVQTTNDSQWRSSRTIMFCNWDAEEYGLIGSTEFVEEFANILNDRAVAYLNVDLISSNQSL